DDVSLDIHRGETLGVIGGNGSGKSTLLRVLAGIFPPDRGRIESRCERIMLLSLSLGFDGELTGRDNALLSGVLLGGRRRFVESKLEEIIAFAELEEQVDDPLKTYSSGMRARLGFSVALMMQADLMLIDEVLGVGDGSFQKKARDAMLARVNSEQTVVYVSHAMNTVTEICQRTLWLDHGHVMALGPTDEVIAAYERTVSEAPKARPQLIA
ncbi:MAG: ATP-binding cassette domain-containing protein, partial [Pseudomonadota bacterium]